MAQQSNRVRLVKQAFTELMKGVGTSIPGHVLAFDAGRQIAQVQVGIERLDVDGTRVTPPPLIECPVFVYGGSAWCVEGQIDPGDEGLIVFSQRCIDAWVQQGGVAPNPIARFHDINDAVFMPGIRSQPNKVAAHANDGVRLRNAAGDKYVWLHANGDIEIAAANVTINASGSVTITGTGAAINTDSLTHNGTNVGDDHTHGGVESGPSSTGGPQ